MRRYLYGFATIVYAFIVLSYLDGGKLWSFLLNVITLSVLANWWIGEWRDERD